MAEPIVEACGSLLSNAKEKQKIFSKYILRFLGGPVSEVAGRTQRGRKLMRVLSGERVWPPPVWMMRQAGRYLPEYRASRAQAGSFLDLCYTPQLAREVTLQPIRRFGFDAAILFSDILVVPDALGQKVRFVEGEGPLLETRAIDDLAGLDPVGLGERLAPVYEAVAGIRAALDDEVTLIGFAGAPWTLATYMIAGRGTPDQGPARRMAQARPSEVMGLIDVLVEATAAHLVAQLEAGADTVQLFDSWAGNLDDLDFSALVVDPTRRIVDKVRAGWPGARIIGFPKGAGGRLADFVTKTGVDAVGAGWQASLDLLARDVQPLAAVQGNLDPLRLVTGGAGLDAAVDHILEKLGGGRLIFNLGHGITPDGDIANVARMLDRVRSAR